MKNTPFNTAEPFIAAIEVEGSECIQFDNGTHSMLYIELDHNKTELPFCVAVSHASKIDPASLFLFSTKTEAIQQAKDIISANCIK